jgi:hypothetical protein
MTSLASKFSLQARNVRRQVTKSAGYKVGQARGRDWRGVPFTAPGQLAVEPSPPPVHFPSDPNSIVTVNVSTVIAPTPNTYQQTGCFVSYGATQLQTQEVALLTQRQDLDDVLYPEVVIQSLTWNNGIVTCTIVGGGPTWTAGDQPLINIQGCVPDGYNGVGLVGEVIDATSFTYASAALATDPGPATTMGTVQPAGATELGQMATTFFAQGNSISVWVLELGPQAQPSAQASLLETWLGINPRSFYGYLLPRAVGASEAGVEAFRNLFKQYQNPEAMTYFWLTVTTASINLLDETYKCVIQMIEAPACADPINLGDPEGEFSLAAMFYNAMLFRPSSSNPVAPMAFKYLYGVTNYPTQNNGPLLKSFKSSNTNYVSTGAEGGIAFCMVYCGVTKDGQDYFNWWWTIDWVQIQVNIDVSNRIINGSNNPLAPLYYDQTGIDALESTLAQTMTDASAFGMVVGAIMMSQMTGPQLQQAIDNGTYAGQCNVNAVPFIPYAQTKPGDYKIGEYDGLSTLFIPKRGFIHVLINVVASEMVIV